MVNFQKVLSTGNTPILSSELMKMPVISVVMPVYNGEKYLREAIESILNQTYSNFEFIILNDGSTDKTEEIILSYDDPRIVYVKNDENMQIVKTLNKGIALAKGKYIARMDADDISLPKRFERELSYLQNHSECSAVFTKIQKIDESSELMGFWTADQQNISHTQIAKILPFKNCVAHPTVMIRSKILKQYCYDHRVKGSEDYHLWLSLIADGYILEKIDEVLLFYRIHKSSITQQSVQGIKGTQKQVSAKFFFLMERCKYLRCSSFEWDVVKGVCRDCIGIAKIIIKPLLREVAMRFGRFLWYFYPKKLPSVDILFIFKNADMGGAERVQLALLEVLKEYKSITLLSHKSHGGHFLGDYRKYTTIKDISIFSNFILPRWITSGYMQKMIERSSVKVVFGSLSGLFYDIAMNIDAQHTVFVDLFHACDNNLEYYSLDSVERLDARITIDDKTKETLCILYNSSGIEERYKDRIALVYNGVKVPPSLPKKHEGQTLNLLFVGRDVPVKRVHMVREIATKMPMASFVLAGVSARPNDTPNLRAVGKVTDVTGYYEQADILLLTSKREGFPMVVMEAMANGVIPICTDVGGISKHIMHGKNGFLIDANWSEGEIVEGFIKTIKMLENDKQLKERVSREAYEYAKKHFDIRHFKETYQKLFQEWIEKNED